MASLDESLQFVRMEELCMRLARLLAMISIELDKVLPPPPQCVTDEFHEVGIIASAMAEHAMSRGGHEPYGHSAN